MTDYQYCIPQNEITVHVEVLSGALFSNVWQKILSSSCHKIAIITQASLRSAYVDPLKQHLASLGASADIFTIPCGEEGKSLSVFTELAQSLFAQGYGRDTLIIGLGGGVVTDVSTFIASTYCRGVRFVLVPTTLLAMVDAAIGGKGGVNVLKGKNYMGSIYHPEYIIVDPKTLLTLPEKEYLEAFSEVLKHSIILDPDLFAFMEQHLHQITQRDLGFIEQLLLRNIQLKSGVVVKDEKEKGLRSLLNFGHTVAHAVEVVSKYSISHGAAVFMGVLVETEISFSIGLLSTEERKRIFNWVLSIPLQLPWDILENKDLIEVMAYDKKNEKAKPRFVLVKKIGTPFSKDGNVLHEVFTEQIKRALQEVLNAVRSH